MSNYAYLITSKNQQLPSSFVKKFNSLNVKISHHKDWTIYFFSNAAQSCQYEFGYFKGYYIDHDNERVGFSQLKSMYKGYYEGCFINIEETLNEDVFNIHNDVFGLMPLLYSIEDNIIMASDSFYFLKKIRESLGLSLTFDYASFVSRLSINAITSHPLSSSTFAEEIKYALPGSIIKVSLKSIMKAEVIHKGAKNIFKLQENIGYEDSIRQAAHQLCGSLGGIIESGVLPCNIDLTGGLDSRLVLSGATPFLDSEHISIGSQVRSKNDYTVAKEICQTFGLKLNKKDTSQKIKINAGAMWIASNAGFTDTLYTCKSQRVDDIRFNVGGHGAEIFKGNYGWRKINEIGKNIKNEEIYRYMQAELRKGLEEFGINYEDDIGSEWHYLAFRNAIHGSRGTQVSNYYLRPLMMKSLVHNMKVEKKTNKYKINPVSDMLIYINPELAKISFDDKRKNITQDDLDRISKTIGKYNTRSVCYTVDTRINLASNGYILELLDMAKEDGFSEQISSDNFGLYINNTVLPKDDLLKYSVNYLLEYALDPNKPKISRDMAISKILSLNLFVK